MDLLFRSRITVVSDVLASPVGHETVLLNPETELCMIIDQHGATMWHALASTSSIQDAFDQLSKELDVKPERLRSDLMDFVGRLWLNSMIVIKVGPEASPAREESKTVAVPA